MKASNFIFLLIMFISTILAISCNSWFTSWFALELNLMVLIPLLINKVKFSSSNVAIKYFLIQALASIIIIFSFIFFYFLSFSNSINISSEIINMSLFMKSGIPPFHFWLPQVMEMSNLIQSFLILTWQKIAPFSLISFFFEDMMVIILCISAMVGALGGINQNSILKIMAFSSMIHGSWMIFSIIISEKLWYSYFIMYTFIVISFFIFMFYFKIKLVSMISNFSIKMSFKLMFSLSLLSMGGLPPFLGFMAKILVIKKMMLLNFIYNIIFLVGFSFISLLYYTRVCYNILLSSNSSEKFLMFKSFKTLTLLMMASLYLNLMAPFMVFLT